MPNFCGQFAICVVFDGHSMSLEYDHVDILGRESLYKSLSKSGNPKIETLAALLDVMGLRLGVEAKPAKS
jgi:hypothetical protein